MSAAREEKISKSIVNRTPKHSWEPCKEFTGDSFTFSRFPQEIQESVIFINKYQINTYICELRRDLQLLQMSAKTCIRWATDICVIKSVNVVANNSNVVANNSNPISDISPVQ